MQKYCSFCYYPKDTDCQACFVYLERKNKSDNKEERRLFFNEHLKKAREEIPRKELTSGKACVVLNCIPAREYTSKKINECVQIPDFAKEAIKQKAIEIIKEIENQKGLEKHISLLIGTGAIYIACILEGHRINQENIAQLFGISTLTVGKQYRFILNNVPKTTVELNAKGWDTTNYKLNNYEVEI